MKGNYQFSSEQWSRVAEIIGNLADVEAVDFGVGAIEFVSLLSAGELAQIENDSSLIRPATHSDVRAYLETRLLRVRAYPFQEEIVGRVARDQLAIANAAQKLLKLLPEIDRNAPIGSVLYSEELRAQLHALVASTSETAAEIDGAMRKPKHRPPLPVYKIVYWAQLMQFWTAVLKRPATNSPGGPLVRFIYAASMPANDMLSPTEGSVYEFVKKHRAKVWGEAKDLPSAADFNPRAKA